MVLCGDVFCGGVVVFLWWWGGVFTLGMSL